MTRRPPGDDLWGLYTNVCSTQYKGSLAGDEVVHWRGCTSRDHGRPLEMGSRHAGLALGQTRIWYKLYPIPTLPDFCLSLNCSRPPNYIEVLTYSLRSSSFLKSPLFSTIQSCMYFCLVVHIAKLLLGLDDNKTAKSHSICT